jgi:hypothetical protein
MMPPHEPGLIQDVAHGLGKIVEPLMRPINVVSHAISDRVQHWLSRKPKLSATIHPQTPMWCLAFMGEKTGMQLSFMAGFTHDDTDRTLLLTGAYIKGTKQWHSFTEPIEVPPELITPQFTLGAFVHPVVAKIGETWKGRLIFVDQFKRIHKTEKIEFKFVGPKENPLKVAKAEASK